jgi:hypothetical protein
VLVVGIEGVNYGPVTISGSGTSNLLITLATPITVADRVTLTIGNSQVITYTRRLDVLPGDVNDDDAVNTTDGVLILNNMTPSHAYHQFDDLNGDGAVDTKDFTLERSLLGTVLPGLPPQMAAGGEGHGAVALLTAEEVAPVLAEAINLWGDSGISAHDLATLDRVTVRIVSLPAGYLGGTAIGGETIYLSSDGAGYGWFTSATASMQAGSGQGLVTTGQSTDPSSKSGGHEDLLTVILHELGHSLGLKDLDPSRFPTDLMAETLATGVRRLPSNLDLAAAMAVQTVPSRAALVDAVFGSADAIETLLLTSTSASGTGLPVGDSWDQTTISTETNRGTKGHRVSESHIIVK